MPGVEAETGAKEALIRKLLSEGNTRSKIVEITGLQDRTIRNYIHRIHEQDRKTYMDQATESAEHRALLIKQKYEALAEVCEGILHDDKKSPRDRIEAGKTIIGCHNNIYNMIKDGPLAFKTVEVKALEDKNDSS